MKKPASSKSFLLLILVSVIILIVASGIITTGKNSTTQITPKETSQNKNGSNLKTFESSETLKFSIKIPDNYTAEEKFSAVTLTSNNGIILISRNGTNLLSLAEYLNYFDSKRKLTVNESKEIRIENYQAVSRFMTFTEEKIKQKSIFIYIDNNVYIMSTENESLYSDLDQIAQSFKYIP